MTQVQSQPRVGFLDLSAELRNSIYDLTLCADADCISIFKGSGRLSGISALRIIRSTRSRPLSAIILRLCRQICNEALPVLYGSNTIEIPTRFMPEFWRQIGDNVKRIRHLILLRDRPSQYPARLLSPSGLGGLRSLKLSLGPFSLESLDLISEKRALIMALLPILDSMTAHCVEEGKSVNVENLLQLDVFILPGKSEARTAQWYKKSIFDDLQRLLTPA